MHYHPVFFYRLSGREVFNSEKIEWLGQKFPTNSLTHTQSPFPWWHPQKKHMELISATFCSSLPLTLKSPSLTVAMATNRRRPLDDAPFPHHSFTGRPPKACDSEPWMSSPLSPYSSHPWLLLSLEFAVLDDFKPCDKRIHRPFPSPRLS